MPGKYGHGFGKLSFKGKAPSIKAAWASKKRKKVGLVQRTLESQGRQIKALKSSKEAKYKGTVVGSQTLSGDVDADGETAAGLPVRLDLTGGIGTGGNRDQRIGRKVTIKRISCHVKFMPPTGVLAESANRCTAVLVHDKDPTNGLPTIQDLYDLDAPTATLNTAFYDPTQVGGKGENESRFKVLARKTIWVGSHPNCMPEGYLNLFTNSPYVIDYGDATATTATAFNQTLRLFLYSDSTAAPNPRFSVTARMSYTDS